MATATRAAVGRDALIPPDPAAEQGPAGGYGIRPYDRRRVRGRPGKCQPHAAAPLRPPLASCTILARLTRGGVVEGAETALTASIVYIYAKFGVLSIPKRADLLYNLDKSS